jgi:dihydrofolate reductase
VALAGGEDAWVIGGAKVYEHALPVARRVVATVVRGFHPADAFFPRLRPDEWAGRLVEAHWAFDVWHYERTRT